MRMIQGELALGFCICRQGVYRSRKVRKEFGVESKVICTTRVEAVAWI